MTSLKDGKQEPTGKTSEESMPLWERRLEEAIKSRRELTPEEWVDLEARIDKALEPHLKELGELLRQLKGLDEKKR